MYKPNNDLILIVETYPRKRKKDNKNINNKLSNISLYKMKKILLKDKNDSSESYQYTLTFDYEIFEGFFDTSEIRHIDFDEKKQNIYIINDSNIMTCFNILKGQYVLNYTFNEQIFSLSVNSTNNLIAIAFKEKVCIYGNLKNNFELFSDLKVKDSLIKWSIKGDFLIATGINNANQNMYCVYFIDSESYETINVIENISSKVEEIQIINNDKYLFLKLSSSFIAGMHLNIYKMQK